jgi:4-hydroxybenzoate polyprenyltransferase
MNPNIRALLHTPEFIVGIVNTLLIMSTSMVINDLFDIPLDKINNPGRPLITGEVKISEAIGFSAILLGISEYLSFMYLPQNLQMVIHAAIANVLLYTPVFKKVPFLKNLSCAGLIAFSTFFTGLTVSPNILADFTSLRDYSSFFFNKNLGLLVINTQLIFFGSLYIEVLLDMCDVNGDKQNGINTLPVIYGNELAFKIANGISYVNILLNFMELSVLYNLKAGTLLMLFYSPMLYYLKETKKNGFTKENIIKNANKTTLPLFMVLTYFCVLPLIVLK